MERFVLPRLLANRTEAGRVSLVIRLDFMQWLPLGSELGGQGEKRARISGFQLPTPRRRHYVPQKCPEKRGENSIEVLSVPRASAKWSNLATAILCEPVGTPLAPGR